MPLSSRTHAVLDFATAATLLALPRLLGAGRDFTRIATGMALTKIAYALFTRSPFAPALSGAALCALPFVLRERRTPALTAAAVGLGVFGIAAAALTSNRSQPLQVPGVRSSGQRSLPTASAAESLAIGATVFVPTIAKGPVIRRPKVVGVGEALGDTLAVKAMQALRAAYGAGPVMLAVPFRHQAVLLDPEHVRDARVREAEALGRDDVAGLAQRRLGRADRIELGREVRV